MRARLALRFAGITVELREVILKDKPAQLIQISPKGTVPVMQLLDGRVIDESIEVAYWALETSDPLSLIPKQDAIDECKALIHDCDYDFKQWLDKYKYADRHPQYPIEHYREEGEKYLARLEARLQCQKYLLAADSSLADIAIMPFVRQFAMVDMKWFEDSQYTALKRWLTHWLQSEDFLAIMKKYPQWQEGQEITLL